MTSERPGVMAARVPRSHDALDAAPADGAAARDVPGALRLDLLLAFVVLAEELHFTRAATRLFMSQSGLSRRINQVERIVGADLVVRTTRSVELTVAGSAFLPHARAVLSAGCLAAAAARSAGSPA